VCKKGKKNQKLVAINVEVFFTFAMMKTEAFSWNVGKGFQSQSWYQKTLKSKFVEKSPWFYAAKSWVDLPMLGCLSFNATIYSPIILLLDLALQLCNNKLQN